MCQLSESSKVKDVPIPYLETIVEQAFCVLVGDKTFAPDCTLIDLSQEFMIPWPRFIERLETIKNHSAALLSAKLPPENTFTINIDSNDNEDSPNPFIFHDLIEEKLVVSILIKGGKAKDRFSAALYMRELGFTEVFISER